MWRQIDVQVPTADPLAIDKVGFLIGVSQYMAIHKEFISYRNTKCVSQYITIFPFSI